MYSPTIGSYRSALLDLGLIADISFAFSTGTTPTTIYAKNQDWSTLTNIDGGFNYGSAGGHEVTLSLKKNGTLLVDAAYTGASAWAWFNSTVIPDALKNYGLFEIILVSDTALDQVFVKDLKIMRRDI